MFYTKDIILGPDGKPVFIGKDQPAPKVLIDGKTQKGAQMQCPVCNGWFDYLVGDDTTDGGRRGCEKDWRPAKGGVHANTETTEEVIS